VPFGSVAGSLAEVFSMLRAKELVQYELVLACYRIETKQWVSKELTKKGKEKGKLKVSVENVL
jgi:hypothetical protein